MKEDVQLNVILVSSQPIWTIYYHFSSFLFFSLRHCGQEIPTTWLGTCNLGSSAVFGHLGRMQSKSYQLFHFAWKVLLRPPSPHQPPTPTVIIVSFVPPPLAEQSGRCNANACDIMDAKEFPNLTFTYEHFEINKFLTLFKSFWDIPVFPFCLISRIFTLNHISLSCKMTESIHIYSSNVNYEAQVTLTYYSPSLICKLISVLEVLLFL